MLRRVAVHDNENLHVAAMGFWATYFVKDDTVKKCGKMPKDITELNRPKKFDRTPNYRLVVPQLTEAEGVFTAWDGNPMAVGDDFFRPAKVVDPGGSAGVLALRRPQGAHGDRRERAARLLLAVHRTTGSAATPSRRRCVGTTGSPAWCIPTSMSQDLEVK